MDNETTFFDNYDAIPDEKIVTLNLDALAQSLKEVFNVVQDTDLTTEETSAALIGAIYSGLYGTLKVLAAHQRNNRKRAQLLAASV